MATQQQVIDAFLSRKRGKASALTTDGHSLYSYSLVIAQWMGDTPIVFDYTATGGAYQSATTSKHVGMVKREVPTNQVMLVELARKLKLIH